jgi:hypothetical protein
MFEPTAFDNQASGSQFLEALADNNVSGIEVIAAKSTKEIIKIGIFNCFHIQVALTTATSTHI